MTKGERARRNGRTQVLKCMLTSDSWKALVWSDSEALTFNFTHWTDFRFSWIFTAIFGTYSVVSLYCVCPVQWVRFNLNDDRRRHIINVNEQKQYGIKIVATFSVCCLRFLVEHGKWRLRYFFAHQFSKLRVIRGSHTRKYTNCEEQSTDSFHFNQLWMECSQNNETNTQRFDLQTGPPVVSYRTTPSP